MSSIDLLHNLHHVAGISQHVFLKLGRQREVLSGDKIPAWNFFIGRICEGCEQSPSWLSVTCASWGKTEKTNFIDCVFSLLYSSFFVSSGRSL